MLNYVYNLGAYTSDNNGRVDAGSGYIIWGRSSFSSSYDLASLGSNGIRFNGSVAGDQM